MTPFLTETLKELIERYIAPNRAGIVKQCVFGDAEYQGTVRINASAIPLFRAVKDALTAYGAKEYQRGREEALKNVGMLRQWLNERPGDKLVTNEDLLYFLEWEARLGEKPEGV